MQIKKLLLATSNQGKIAEMKELLGSAGIEILTQAHLGICIDVEEDAETLEGNAIKKAQSLNLATGIPALADDTGLEVLYLNGQPGVYSARYAGPEEDASANRLKLLDEMDEVDDRSAQFRTVIAFVDDKDVHTFEGVCSGRILPEMRGEKGFGYDPLFCPDGSELSFSEMSLAEKNSISHRAKALQAFLNFIDKD